VIDGSTLGPITASIFVTEHVAKQQSGSSLIDLLMRMPSTAIFARGDTIDLVIDAVVMPHAPRAQIPAVLSHRMMPTMPFQSFADSMPL
jgi:hypothetical protein